MRLDVWTIVELCLGIVSACLPTMKPLFSHTKIASKFTSNSKSQDEKWSEERRSGRSLTRPQARTIDDIPSLPSTPSTPDTPDIPNHDISLQCKGGLGSLKEVEEDQA